MLGAVRSQVLFNMDCEHIFKPLGFEMTEKTETTIESIAAIVCEKCGMFRTKILTFRRELGHNNKQEGERKHNYATNGKE